MIIAYTGQDRLDAGTALAIARSIENNPYRWHTEFIWMVRDDGFRLAIFMPYENKLITPRWMEWDTFGAERLVIPPMFSGYMLKKVVERWFKKTGQDLSQPTITKSQIESGLYNRLGINFGKAA